MSTHWVPVESCTLPTVEQPMRVAEFDALFASSLLGVDRRGPGWLRLRADAVATSRAAELVARESECCSFFAFAIESAGPEVLIDVRVPESRREVLDGLERRARVALAARRGAVPP